VRERLATGPEKIFVLLSDALGDTPSAEAVPYSMRQELEGVLKTGQRIAGCMAKCGRGGRRRSLLGCVFGCAGLGGFRAASAAAHWLH